MKSLVPATRSNILKAAEIIKSGGVVSFPTETVYGLGADALNSDAVARIFEIKNRPSFDPLIVHIANINDIKKICHFIPKAAKKLMLYFWPGPLSIVLKKKSVIPDIVTSGLDTVAVRMPNNHIALQLIMKSNTAIAAPSANPFGYLSPTNAAHVSLQLGTKLDLILDGGSTKYGIESTIVSFNHGNPVILRIGSLPIEQIESVIGKVQIMTSSSGQKLQSPGQMARHYSPTTPLKLITSKTKFPSDKSSGLLAFRSPRTSKHFKTIEILSKKGDLREAAANLFGCLHRLERKKLDIIFAEPVPETGLGRAIMDRLRRAAA
ncbi:MAG: threonylcarbamoyl-AMP synthase [Planctomycetes bacterium]|nr:threonylcarbamoyl-AMP synthase [Planctomycetota bacterium]